MLIITNSQSGIRKEAFLTGQLYSIYIDHENMPREISALNLRDEEITLGQYETPQRAAEVFEELMAACGNYLVEPGERVYRGDGDRTYTQAVALGPQRVFRMPEE